VYGTRKSVVGNAGHDEFLAPFGKGDTDFLSMSEVQLPFGSFDMYGLSVDRNLDTVKDRDRLFSDS